MTKVNEHLRVELLQLFAQDQVFLGELEASKSEESFARAYDQQKDRVLGGRRPAVFYGLAVYQAWATEPDAPELVKRYVAFMSKAIQRLQEIVGQYGWPHKDLVGDDAAFFVMFLFGHADTANQWRRTQLPAIEKAYRAGEIDPRLYAHLCDRIEACDEKPQIFGTIMGPGDEPRTSSIYWPLAHTEQQVDARRVELGLPPLEHDLSLFRQGATIGPYMTPTPRA